MTVTVRNDQYEQRVRDSFSRQNYMEFIGAELTKVEPGAADITLKKHDGLTQQHGFFHGGVIGALADNASGYSAFTLADADSSILTVEYKINLVSPADGDLLIARGRVVKPGRTLVPAQSDVFVVKDGKEKLVATALVTLMLMVGWSDDPNAKT